MKCVGLDLGTTKIAGLLLETGAAGRPARVLRVASREHEAGLPAAHPWEDLQDPGRLLALARELLRELVAEAGAADGLCVTGQMHGILYVDAAGNAVSPLATWLDQRAGRPHPEGGSFAEVLSARTGYRVPPGYGAATHFYDLNNGLVPGTAAGLCSLMDFVTMRLAGGSRPVTDATIAASFGLYAPAGDRVDPEALRKAGLDDVPWSRVAPAGTRIGATPAGTAVFTPLGDHQASFLGSVRDVEHAAQLNVGTGGQISVFAARPGALPFPLETRPFPGGGCLHVGAPSAAARPTRCWRSSSRRVCESLGGVRPEAPALRADEPAGREGGEETPLEVDTRFQGTRADPRITGRIEHITPGNLTPAALVRGFPPRHCR